MSFTNMVPTRNTLIVKRLKVEDVENDEELKRLVENNMSYYETRKVITLGKIIVVPQNVGDEDYKVGDILLYLVHPEKEFIFTDEEEYTAIDFSQVQVLLKQGENK